MDTFIRLVEASAKLAGALAWPAVALIVLWWFGSAIRHFLSSMSEGSFKAFGVEGTAKRIVQQSIISADLLKSAPRGQKPQTVEQINTTVAKSLTAAELASTVVNESSTKPKEALWVDDQPDNNEFEKRALTALGFAVQEVEDTETAMEKIRERRFDLIISDLSRPGDKEAGVTLIRRLRDLGDDTPVIIYTSEISSQSSAGPLKDAGAYAVTHLASDLIVKAAEAVGPMKLSTDFLKRARELRNRYAHIRSSS